MTDPIQHTPTKAEREARRALRDAERAAKLAEKIRNLPDSVHGSPVVEIDYTAVSKKRVKELRRDFTDCRRDFLMMLARDRSADLKAAGLSDSAIALIAKGRAPNGFNVHHKVPLAGGGLNVFSNFILIKDEPYHKDFHKVSDLQIVGMNEGEKRKVKIPMPAGCVFVPPDRQPEQVKTVSPLLLLRRANSR